MTRTASARTTGDLLLEGIAFLEAYDIPSASADAEWLLADLLALSRGLLRLMPERLVDEEVVERYRDLLVRRSLGEPTQYLLGWEGFCGVRLSVRPGVLIPRPETECLVEWAVELLKERDDHPSLRVVDLGTGSGAIAIALALACPRLTVDAVEKSRDSLIVASENCRRLHVGERVRLFLGDLFEPLGLPDGSLDLVISNPPYIPSGEIGGLPVEVRDHEPVPALDGGADGMAFHRRIFAEAKQFLKPGGWLLMEIGLGQAGALLEEARRLGGYEGLAVREDLQGVERMIGARRS